MLLAEVDVGLETNYLKPIQFSLWDNSFKSLICRCSHPWSFRCFPVGTVMLHRLLWRPTMQHLVSCGSGASANLNVPTIWYQPCLLPKPKDSIALHAVSWRTELHIWLWETKFLSTEILYRSRPCDLCTSHDSGTILDSKITWLQKFTGSRKMLLFSSINVAQDQNKWW